MNNSEVILIKQLLKKMGREDLYSEYMVRRSYVEVLTILQMEEWKDQRFSNLLTSTIWNINYDEISKILHKNEWNDPKFSSLITSTIWRSNYDEIDKILKMEEWNNPKFSKLLTSTIWNSNYDEISKILSMKEWNDLKYSNLLTSNIWKSSYQVIKAKLYSPYLQDDKYKHLLVPSIFTISLSNIENGIELLRKYNIDQYVTNKCLRHKTSNLELLIEYLINNNIDLVVEDQKNSKLKLNPILSCEKGKLKTKYGIDLSKLEEKGKSR